MRLEDIADLSIEFTRWGAHRSCKWPRPEFAVGLASVWTRKGLIGLVPSLLEALGNGDTQRAAGPRAAGATCKGACKS
jgi:hypothetical protein